MTNKELIRSIGTYPEVAKLLGKSLRQINYYVDGAKIPVNVLTCLKEISRGNIMDVRSEDKTSENVKRVLKQLGGNVKVAKALNKTYQAVYNWSIGKAKPDDSNWYLMKQWLKDRAIHDSKDLEN